MKKINGFAIKLRDNDTVLVSVKEWERIHDLISESKNKCPTCGQTKAILIEIEQEIGTSWINATEIMYAKSI